MISVYQKLNKFTKISAKSVLIRGILFLIVSGGIFMVGGFVSTSITDGTIGSANKYAWSENMGWLNFGTSEGNVHISDSALTGYAYGENAGWISLNCSNDNSCAVSNYKVANDGYGVLSGYAYGENAGWIDFKPTGGGVIINSSGEFSGQAYGENTGWIIFDCSTTNSCTTVSYKVQTDWRPRTARSQCNNAIDDDNDGKIDYPDDPGCSSLEDTSETDPAAGGLPVVAYNPPTPPATTSEAPAGFSIVINNGVEYTNSRTVTLKLDGGTDAVNMAISNFSDFRNASQEPYQTTKEWTLSEGEEIKTVYVKFFTEWGQFSEIVSDSIIFNVSNKVEENISKPAEVSQEVPAGQTEMREEERSESKVSELLKPIVEAPVREIKKTFDKVVGLFKSKPEEVAKPEEEIKKLVPEEAPLAMKGEWSLLPEESINKFALTPLPEELSLLLSKFPDLEKTFTQLGINKITDLEKLQGIKLILPGLTESLGLSGSEGLNGEIILSGGIPLGDLPPVAKDKIPTEIVFAKSAGGLVDFNMELTVSKEGEAQSKINVISGRLLSLLIKPEGEVYGIKGYIIFKGRTDDLSLAPVNNTNFLSSLAVKPALAEEEKTQFVDNNSGEERMVLSEFNYSDGDKDGIYTAEIQAPIVQGKYEIITEVDHKDPKLGKKEIRLITVVDPEGYVYEKNGDKETRLPDAVISLFWQNPENKNYELWPAKNYQQGNPQTTDITGRYSFLVPPGQYYLKVEMSGYSSWEGQTFLVKEGNNVHFNIEMKAKFGYLKVVDWKVALLIIVTILLLYNFYRDRKRKT